MKLGIRIFCCYLLIFSVCFYYPIDWMLDNLRTRYLEGVEDPLVDHANILAALLGNEMENGGIDVGQLYAVFDEVHERNLSAKIYELEKTSVDLDVYITDSKGILLFDSENPENIGKDYSAWRDVKFTLAGKYGARTTKKIIEDKDSSVLYVAAPIMSGGELAGVVTVAKPTTNINNFLAGAKPQLVVKGTLALVVAALLSFLASVWLTMPIRRLTRYANQIREGRRGEFPRLDKTEIGEMGNALRNMQEALEGKKYIEQYVQSLTHEVKSPLSAIRGAAELLAEDMDPGQRERFLDNIRNEAGRIQLIVDRMLELATLENREMLNKVESVSLQSLVKTVVESKQPMLSRKDIKVNVQIEPEIFLQGDSFLLHQSIGNVLQNGIDFSPELGQINISAKKNEQGVILTVEDEGDGIPGFALNKVFQKFYSLQRPDTGKKSTGLGLNFVREIVHLHGGVVALENKKKGGLHVVLQFPLDDPRGDGQPG